MKLACSVVPIVFLASGAGAQLIRPDSATTTSAFNASYVAANTINGSGLPAGFTPSDAHATYVAGNHWTTQVNRTLGESITWTFTTPQSLGGIHLWGHRSDNIANNPHYEIVRYDLELFDGANGAGTLLASFLGRTALPDVSVAQTSGFTITPGVRSARLTVRATANGNSSPYTGLAEVAFAPCIGVGQGPGLASTPLCYTGEATFNAQPTGSGPFQFA